MINNIIILCALRKEANALLFQSQLRFNEITKKKYVLSTQKYKIFLAITGIGSHCQIDIESDIRRHANVIIKAGTCAVVDPSLPLMTPLIPGFTGNGEDSHKIIIPESLGKKAAAYISGLVTPRGLLTVDKPLFDRSKHEEILADGYGLVDMESFRIVENFPGKPVLPLVIGTDQGDNQAKETFFENLNTASHILKESIVTLASLL